MNSRDLQLTIRQRFDQKQNVQSFKRVVITDQQGNQSGAGSIWANRTLRRVWYMAHGAAQPAQAYCSGAKIPNPQIGMRAFLGFSENSNEPELFEDPTLRKTNTTGQPVTITPEDLQPGGRYFLWIQSKALQPLATFPTSNTGLKVTVVAGYYPYIGTRKYYGGVVGLSLAASVPGAGLHRKVGLYLDASNVLQTVNGSTVATTAIAPEPTWPSGAFRLSTVTLAYGQTSIDFSTDIEDYRMIWSDENGGGGSGWPFDNVLTVSTTNSGADYTSIGAAITAASAGDAIFLDSETFTEAITVNKNVTIFGLGAAINSTTDAYTVTITSPCTLLYLNIRNGTSGALAGAVLVDGATSAVLERCSISKSSGSPTIGAAIHTDGTIGLSLRDCTITASAGTSRYGIYNDPAFSSIFVYGGSIFGTTNSIYGTEATSLLNLYNTPTLSGSVSFTSTDTTGFYNDSSGNLLALVGTGITSGVWLVDESATLKKKYATLAAAISAAATGDVIELEADTYTITGSPLSQNKSIAIIGQGIGRTIITSALSNNPTIDVAADNTTFQNLTIQHTGTGSTAGPLSTDNTNLVLDNVYLDKTSGASTTSYGLWMYGGSVLLRNGTKISTTAGTTKYGILNDTADTTVTIGPGCEVGGDTADVYSARAGSVLEINNCIFTNNDVDWAGSIKNKVAALGVAVYNSAAISVANNTITALAMNSERQDNAAYHSTSTNNSRLTVPTGLSGWYQITGNILFAASSAGARRQTSIRLNGSTNIAVSQCPPTTSGGAALSVAALWYLADGDYIELCAFQDSGGSLDVSSTDALAIGAFSPEIRMVRL